MSRVEKKKKEKKFGIGTVIKILFFVIAIPLLIIACIIMYKANAYPDKVPDVFGIKPMIVLSGSMETSIHTGDLVFVKMIDPQTLEKGDVIAFRNETDTVTTHRIIEIVEQNGEKYFKTKGDANNAEDSNLVEMDDVEGVYMGRIAGVGNFLMFMQQPIGLAVVLLIILVIGLIWLYIVNKRDEKKFAKENEQDRREFEEFKRRRQLEREQENNINEQNGQSGQTEPQRVRRR